MIQKLMAIALLGLPALAQEPGPSAPAPSTSPPPAKPISPQLAALLKFKPKTLRNTPKAESRVIAATRGGGEAPVKIVALAPASGGISVSSQPRLWWWQSAATAAGEMEFALTRMDGRPRSVLVLKLGAMKEGYNAIDLASPAINPKGIKLDPKVEYQWTLGCFSELNKDSVFVRMQMEENPGLSKQLAADPYAPETITSLSDSGNWYELFDTVAFSSRLAPDNPELAAIRKRLLNQVGLDDKATP